MKTAPDVAPPPFVPQSAPPPVLDDLERPSGVDIEAAAEQMREHAFNAEYKWRKWDTRAKSWSPYRLYPLSLDRWTWWHRMEIHNAPIPRAEWIDPAKWADGHVPTAWSLLFLCSHDADTILNLVPSPALYWFAVNKWAEDNCPGEFWKEALELMRTMEQATKATIATPRPTGKGKRRGNGHRP